MTRAKHGYKYQSYATFGQSISPGKGREALWQKVQIFQLKNMVRLNRTHSFLKLEAKFSNLRFVFVHIRF